MGTWSNKPFGNDTALDWLAGLEDSGQGEQIIVDSLNAVVPVSEIVADIAEEAIVAAAIVAAASVPKVSGIDQDAKAWITKAAFSPNREVKQLALEALVKIVSDSELKTLWQEGGGLNGWLKEVEKISSKLSHYLDDEPPARVQKKQALALLPS